MIVIDSDSNEERMAGEAPAVMVEVMFQPPLAMPEKDDRLLVISDPGLTRSTMDVT